MAKKVSKGARGGRRPGAGRKPFLKGKVALTVTLESRDYAKVEKIADREGISLASVIRDAVKAYRGRRR